MNASSDTAAGCSDEGRLRQLLALHEAALDSMPHGLCVVDAEQRVVLFNARYLEMYDLAPEAVRIGMPFLELLHHSAERGNIFPTQVDEYLPQAPRHDGARRAVPAHPPDVAAGAPSRSDFRPVAGGGWIVMVEDVSERQRKEYDLRVQFECYDQAVNHMSHGLCAVDADHRIVLFNDLFLKMYDLSPDVIKVGDLDARRDRARGAARLLPQCHARASVAVPPAEDGAAQAVPAAHDPAQRHANTSCTIIRCRTAAGSRCARTSPNATAWSASCACNTSASIRR